MAKTEYGENAIIYVGEKQEEKLTGKKIKLKLIKARRLRVRR